jgi:hypothetical protein
MHKPGHVGIEEGETPVSIGQNYQQNPSFLDWLIPSAVKRDIASTMRGKYTHPEGPKLSKNEFINRYFIEGYNPMFKKAHRSRHYISPDFQYDADYVDLPTYTSEGGSSLGGNREKEGWKFHGTVGEAKEKAYNLYEEQYDAQVEEGKSYDIDPYAVDYFDPESILSGLDKIGVEYLKGESGLDPKSAIRALKPSDFRGLHSSYYAPFIESSRNPLERGLTEKRATSRAAGGDFAGYGRRGLLEEASEGSYLQGMENIYSDVGQAKSDTLQDIYSTISGWEDLTV